MKKYSITKTLSALLLVVLLLFSMTACGSADTSDKYLTSDVENGYASDSLTSGSSAEKTTEAETIKDTRKIIETIRYSVETKNFDDLVSTLESQALSVGGYIESSDVYGNSEDDDDSRSATYVFRIPSDKVDDFTNYVSDNSNVTNKSVTTEDVTLKYVDIESRIKALKAEKESLEELLKSAQTTSEIIEIRDMLTEVIYEIESYESQLRTLDSQIDYTSITVNIDEVEHTSVVNEQTTFERIATNLAENFRGVWNFIVEFFVFIVSAIPYILLIGINAAIVIVIIKVSINKRRKARAKNEQKVIESQDNIQQ